MSFKHKNQPPTKTRIDALLLKHKLLYNKCISRAVIANGIGLTICGVTISIFGIAAFLIESSMESLYSGLWIGLIVLVSGFVSIASGKHNVNLILLNVNFFISIFTTAAITFVTVIAANIIIRDQNLILSFYPSQFMNESRESEDWRKSNIMLNSLILAISGLACVLSIINFSFSAKAAFSYYSQKGIRLSDSLGQSGLDSIKQRDRIISWIIQQSTQIQSPSSSVNFSSLKFNQKLISNDSPNSLRLSCYQLN